MVEFKKYEERMVEARHCNSFFSNIERECGNTPIEESDLPTLLDFTIERIVGGIETYDMQMVAEGLDFLLIYRNRIVNRGDK